MTWLFSIEHNFSQQNNTAAFVQTVMKTHRLHVHLISMLWMKQKATLTNSDDDRYHICDIKGEKSAYFMSWQ